jgi:hypothetical protein
MKIGIISAVYYGYNYGTSFQAYALCRTLSKLGFDSEQILYDWSSGITENAVLRRFTNSKSYYDRFFSEFVPHSRRVYTNKDIGECVKDYDAFICGSDQIWNVNAGIPIYNILNLALAFVPPYKKKIAYAASIGGSETDERVARLLKFALNDFTAVSVREKSAVSFLQSLSEKPVHFALDPTLLINKDEWADLAVSPKEKDYILIYDFYYNEDLNKAAADYVKERNLKIIRLCCDDENTGPREALGFIKNTECVFTTSFHCTSLSIIFEKKLFVFHSDKAQSKQSTSTRLLDFLSTLKLGNRFITDSAAFIKNFDLEIDWCAVNIELDVLKNSSLQFLKDALNSPVTSPQEESINTYNTYEKYFEILEANGCTDSEIDCEKLLLQSHLAAVKQTFEFNNYIWGDRIIESFEEHKTDGENDIIELIYSTKNIVIYGCNKVGKYLAENFPDRIICFAETKPVKSKFCDFDVFACDSAELKSISKDKKLTFIVTAFQYFEEISKTIKSVFGDSEIANVKE